jgi:hypothetical protein
VPAAVLLLLAPVAAASELVPPAFGVLLPLRGGLVLCALLVCAFAIALEATILLQTHDRVVKGASELFPSASCTWLSALLSLLLASAGNVAPAAVTATWLLLAPLSSPDVLLITLCCRVMFKPAVNLPLLVPLLPLAVVLMPVLVAMTLVLRNVAPR